MGLRIITFAKSFFALAVLSLAAFVITSMDLLTLAKLLAASALVSIAVAAAYPALRGVRSGDTVMVVETGSAQTIISRFGTALHDAKKNSELRIRLANGNEIVGIVQDYDGLIMPPTIRAIYEERLVEKWKY